MADDPLATAPATTDLTDPLAGWQPSASAPPPVTPPAAPKKGIMNTSFRSLPTKDNAGSTWDGDDVTGNISDIRGAFGEGYTSVPPSITNPDNRSFFTPQTQAELNKGWFGRNIVNPFGELIGTGVADVAGVGNSAITLGNEALRSLGLPAPLIRDINLEATNAPVEPLLRPAATTDPLAKPTWLGIPRLQNPDAPVMREMTTPPPATLSELLQRQRAAPTTDPVTAEVIAQLRRSTGGTPNAPPPPAPFTTTPGPTAQPAPAAPGGGLLGPTLTGGPLPGPRVAPQGGVLGPIMPAADIRTIAEGYYSPADKAVAQGVMLPVADANGIRKVLTDAVPTDPDKAIAVGDTPLVRLGKDYAAQMGNPMSVDAAMALDRRITAEKQMAYRTGNNDLAGQLGDAQDAIREKMFANSAMASVPQALQAYTQYVKQSQMEDLAYRASLLAEERQGPYMKSQLTTMLKGNAMANWTPEERAAAEQVVQSGNIGAVKNFGIGLIKPAATAVGGGVGGAMFGQPGAVVGGLAGGDVGGNWAARLRAALQKVSLDKIQQQISQGVPPPP